MTDTSDKSNRAGSAARWSLGLLLAINLFNYIDRQVLAAVLPAIQHEFKSSDSQNGALATAFLFSYMCFAPVFGWLADRYSRWMLVGVGVILWSLASGASGLATGIGVLLATRAFVGIGEAAYGPAAPTILSDLFPVERRGQILSWFYVAIPVGGALGYTLGAQVLKMEFAEVWRPAFYVVVPPGLLLGCLALWMRDPRHSGASSQPKPPPSGIGEYKQLLRIRSYLLNTAGMAAMTFAVGGIAWWMPTYMVWRQSELGLVDMESQEAVAKATSEANEVFGPIVVLSGLLGTISGGLIGDRLTRRWPGAYFLVSAVGMMVSFPLVLLLPWVPFPAAWGLIFVACFGLFFNTGPTNAILANVTQPAIRAAGFALNIFVIHALGDAVSPPAMGALNDAFKNKNAGFMLVAVAILLSALFWFCGARSLEQDTKNASTPTS